MGNKCKKEPCHFGEERGGSLVIPYRYTSRIKGERIKKETERQREREGKKEKETRRKRKNMKK